MTTRTLRLLAVSLVGVLALAACDSGSSTSGGSGGGFDPTTAATKLRERGGVQTRGATTLNGQSGPIAARIAYEPYRASADLTVSTGADLARIRYVRIDDQAWIRRAVVPKGIKSLALGLPTVVFRGAVTAPWLPVVSPDAGIVAAIGTPYDPAKLLDRLAAAKVKFTADGSSTVDGTSRDKFVARPDRRQIQSTGVRTVTVWVDGSGVPVQLSLEPTTAGTIRYTIAELSGRVVAHAPGKSQIIPPSRPLPDATGAYQPVLDTTAGTVPVQVLTAPGELDWTCWKVESDPAFVNVAPARPSGGYCVVPIERSGEPDEQFIIPLDAAADAPYELLGIVTTPGATVEFQRFGADPVTVTAGDTGLALYAGPKEQVLGLATVNLPDGGKLICGPVGIDNDADFRAMQGSTESQNALRDAPWNCLPANLADLLNS